MESLAFTHLQSLNSLDIFTLNMSLLMINERKVVCYLATFSSACKLRNRYCMQKKCLRGTIPKNVQNISIRIPIYKSKGV